MKSLDQIETRTPIDSVPFVITEPGSYYLTKSLTHAFSDAIDIQTNEVTIDLNGFTIRSAATDSIAIRAAGRSDVVIRNGIIKGFSKGVSLEGSTNCVVSGLTMRNQGVSAISIEGGPSPSNNISILSCQLSTLPAVGSLVGVHVETNVSSSGTINGLQIKDCRISGFTHGVYVRGGAANIESLVVDHCSIHKSDNFGILLISDGTAELKSVVLKDCVLSEGADGIRTKALIHGLLVSDSIISGFSGYGIQLDSATGGTEFYNVVVRDCSVSDSMHGIHSDSGARIEGNHVSSSSGGAIGTGIAASSGSSTNRSMVFRNTVLGFSTSYSIYGLTTHGPIVTATGVLSSSGSSSHPLANFSD